MGLVRLRGAPPLGAERLAGVGERAEGVALEERRPVAGPGERQRAASPPTPPPTITTRCCSTEPVPLARW